MDAEYGCTHAKELTQEERSIIDENQFSLRELDEDEYEGHPLRIYQNEDFNDTYYVRFEGETDYMKGFVQSAFVRHCSFFIQEHWIPLEDEPQVPGSRKATL